VILTTREHVIAIEPHGQGLLGITLRYPYEIRKEADYFGDLQDERVPKEMLDLATHIVATRSRHFRPEKFEDSLRARSAGTDQEEATRGEDR
jgi:DNA end-binding protein Ku